MLNVANSIILAVNRTAVLDCAYELITLKKQEIDKLFFIIDIGNDLLPQI
jgi:hypothetical protein